MPLQRADIGVLRGGSCAHPPLAQVDFLKTLPRRGRVEIEQRSLRQRQPDCAVDVAGHQLVAAFEPVVKAFEDPSRLIAGFARAFDRHLVAA